MEVDVPGLLDAIKALGVAGGPVFAVLWWLERKERMVCQKEAHELLTQVLGVTNTAANAVTNVTKAVSDVGESTKEVLGLLAQMSEILRSFGALVRPIRKRGAAE